VPRASKAQLDAVRKNAERVGEQLDKEQEDSVFGLAQALDEISEGEALAHIDTRLAFIERQVERLALRREETDRGFQGEFGIMRARLEDALKAVGGTTEEQRSTWTALEKRLSEEVSASEARAAEVLDSVRQDLAAIVQGATSSMERSEARLRGEMKALDEATVESSRSVTDAVQSQKEEISQQAEVSRRELEARSALIKEQLESEVTAARSSMDQLVGRVDSAVAATEQAAAGLLESTTQQMNQLRSLFEEHRDQVEATATKERDALGEQMRSQLASLKAQLETLRESERRELEARIVEGKADIRMEQHLLKESIEAKLVSLAEMIELARSDLLSRVQSSEEKAAGAAIHLEGMVREQRRQIEGGEQEWAVAIQELVEQAATFRIRLEEQSAKISSAQNQAHAEDSAALKDYEAISSRIEMMEARMRGLMGDTIAKMATKLQVLSSQVANHSETTSAAEEQAGAISFLSRRVAELGQRSDETYRRLGALSSENQGGSGDPDALRARIEALEASSAMPAGRPDERAGLRLQQLESSIAQLRADVSSAVNELSQRVSESETKERVAPSAGRPDQSVAEVLDRIGALERAITTLPATLASRKQELVSRIEELERRTPISSSTILPDRRKKGLFG